MQTMDIGGNAAGLAKNGYDIYDNGPSLSNIAGLAGNGLGLADNLKMKCFTAGTQVVVGMEYDADGNFMSYVTMNIEDVNVGDLVYSYDTATGEVSLQKVTDTFVRESDHINYLTIIDENGVEQTIETTDGHPFWVITDTPDIDRAARDYSDGMYHGNLEVTEYGFWVEAKDLKVGDVFLGVNGELSTLINAVRVEQEGGIDVFNFEVESNHNYYILAKEYEYGQTCVLVHNAVFYKAPQGSRSKEQILDELRNGFDPNNYPGEGVFLGDLNVAKSYLEHGTYSNGIQKFTIPGKTAEELRDMGIIEEVFDYAGDAWRVKPENISVFNSLLKLPGQ